MRGAFDTIPDPARGWLLTLRRTIFEVAADTPGVGAISETLKWHQPAYLTDATKSGTTIRLGVSKTGSAALFVHCQTTIVADFQAQFPDDFTYEGNRAVLFSSKAEMTGVPVRLLIRSALTYHLSKSQAR